MARKRNSSYLAALAVRAMSHDVECVFLLLDGAERWARITSRSVREELLDPDLKKKDRGSSVVLHLDDDGPPLPLNDVAEIRRARRSSDTVAV
jgi:hypothetical protein